jgi:hypothetical protein
VNVGPHKLSGQKRTEMKYCTQLWIPDMVPGDPGKCGDAVLTNTPMRMYTPMRMPVVLKRVFRKATSAHPLSVTLSFCRD